MTLKWTDRYGCYSLALPGNLGIGVNWSTDRTKSGYRVSFNNIYLKENSETVPDGQARGVRFARKMLTEALAALDEYEKTLGK